MKAQPGPGSTPSKDWILRYAAQDSSDEAEDLETALANNDDFDPVTAWLSVLA